MPKKPVKDAVRTPKRWLRVWPFYNNRAMFRSPVAKAKATEEISMALDDIIADLESEDSPKLKKSRPARKPKR